MKIILVGASGTVGKTIDQAFHGSEHQVIRVGKSRGDFQVNIEDPGSVAQLYQKINKAVGNFDAVVNATGEVAFAPLSQMTAEQWDLGLRSKLMGQVNLVQQALPYINERGSFTLISGILSDDPILSGVSATMVNRALEGFVIATACELPKNLRINLVSPTVLKDSLNKYAAFFPGFAAAESYDVGQAFKKSVLGIQTGQIYKVYG